MKRTIAVIVLVLALFLAAGCGDIRLPERIPGDGPDTTKVETIPAQPFFAL